MAPVGGEGGLGRRRRQDRTLDVEVGEAVGAGFGAGVEERRRAGVRRDEGVGWGREVGQGDDARSAGLVPDEESEFGGEEGEEVEGV